MRDNVTFYHLSLMGEVGERSETGEGEIDKQLTPSPSHSEGMGPSLSHEGEGKRHIGILFVILLSFLLPISAFAQDEMEPETPQEEAPAQKPVVPKTAAPAPETKDVPLAPPGTMLDMPVAELQALDKITATVSHLEAKVGETVTFGSLNIAVKACRKAPSEDSPEAAAFLQIWEKKPGEDSHWVYSGWMFASSPALAAMDHPVYDIWVVDCVKAPISESSSTPNPVK